MLKIYIFLFTLLSPCVIYSQIKVTFRFKDIATSKDSSATYFMAGNFNNWQPNDGAFAFKKVGGIDFELAENLPAGRYEYKITRGSWAKVESGENGNALANRSFNLTRDTIINITVLNWADEFKQIPPKHTASANVKIMDSLFNIPQLDKKRRIWIYLPPSYQKSDRHYPVIYMQDGQNLFDVVTSGFGEWKIDEILDSLYAEGGKECIIVGIDHGGNDRLKEYNPYDSKYGEGEGKKYTEFLVKTLKPYVDKHYRTKSSAKNTSVAGSSMGGLISMYAIANYPKVFGNAGVFSPAFWIAEQFGSDLKKLKPNLKSNKIYFVAGNLESKNMISDMENIYQIVEPIAKNKNLKLIRKEDGEHKEWFWNREFLDFYKFIVN